MYEPKIPFYQIRDFSAKLSATFDFIRENFKKLFISLILIVLPAAIIVSLAITIVMNAIKETIIISEGGPGNPEDFFASIIIGYLLVIALAVFVGIMIRLITFTYIDLYNKGEHTDIAIVDIFKKSLSKFGGSLLISIISGFAIVLGFLFFIVPGIILSVLLSLAIAVYVFEKTSPMDAIVKSYKLVKDKWLSTFGLLVVASIIAYFVSSIFSIPFFGVYLANIFTLMESAENGNQLENPIAIFKLFSSWYMALCFAIMILGSYLTAVIPSISLAYQYSNLVERQESVGLKKDIEKFDAIQ